MKLASKPGAVPGGLFKTHHNDKLRILPFWVLCQVFIFLSVDSFCQHNSITTVQDATINLCRCVTENKMRAEINDIFGIMQYCSKPKWVVTDSAIIQRKNPMGFLSTEPGRCNFWGKPSLMSSWPHSIVMRWFPTIPLFDCSHQIKEACSLLTKFCYSGSNYWQRWWSETKQTLCLKTFPQEHIKDAASMFFYTRCANMWWHNSRWYGDEWVPVSELTTSNGTLTNSFVHDRCRLKI